MVNLTSTQYCFQGLSLQFWFLQWDTDAVDTIGPMLQICERQFTTSTYLFVFVCEIFGIQNGKIKHESLRTCKIHTSFEVLKGSNKTEVNNYLTIVLNNSCCTTSILWVSCCTNFIIWYLCIMSMIHKYHKYLCSLSWRRIFQQVLSASHQMRQMANQRSNHQNRRHLNHRSPA